MEGLDSLCVKGTSSSESEGTSKTSFHSTLLFPSVSPIPCLPTRPLGHPSSKHSATLASWHDAYAH